MLYPKTKTNNTGETKHLVRIISCLQRFDDTQCEKRTFISHIMHSGFGTAALGKRDWMKDTMKAMFDI